jgi:general secretion pathway protein L
MVFLFLGTDDLSWHQEGSTDVMSGRADELAAKASGQKVVAVIPLADCNGFMLDIAAKSDSQLLAAARFELEDNMLLPVDDSHLALGKRVDGESQVWIISQERMQHWQDELAELNIEADFMVPEGALIGADAGQDLLWLEPGRAILCVDSKSLELDASTLEIYLSSTTDDNLNIISFVGSESLPDFIKAASDNIGYESLDPRVKMSQRFGSNTVNLLQGQYKKASALLTKTKPWWLSLGLGAIVLVLAWGFLAIDNNKVQVQVKDLDQQINQVYKSAFPGSKVVSAKRQMQAKLEGIGAKSSQNTIAELMTKVGLLVKAANGIAISDIDYRQPLLRFVVSAQSLESLEKLAGTLQQKGHDATLKSVRSVANQVSANIEVKVGE